MSTYEYIPSDKVCSKKMIFEIENNIIKNAKIVGGCPGNTYGITKLISGKNIDDVIGMLQGVNCGIRGTSCPDQLAQALIKYKERIN